MEVFQVFKQNKFPYDVAGHEGSGNIHMFTCEPQDDQRFEWIPDGWVASNLQWSMVLYKENGKISDAVQILFRMDNQ